MGILRLVVSFGFYVLLTVQKYEKALDSCDDFNVIVMVSSVFMCF